MTISTAPTKLSYDGDGSTVAFSITWKYFEKSHVVAVLRDANNLETTWAIDTDYTLTDAGVSTGGTLTATTAPASGETLVIDLQPPNTQETSFPLGGNLPASDIEDAVDLAAQRDARIANFIDRIMRVPFSDTRTGNNLLLPIEATRANKILAFDGNGDPTVVATSSAPGSDLSGHLVTATGSANSRTLADRFDAGSMRTSLVVAGDSSIESAGTLLTGSGGAQPKCQVLKANASDGFLTAAFSNDAVAPVFLFVKSRNTSVVTANGTIVQDGDSLGHIRWSGDDGVDFQSTAARIECEVDGTPGTGDMPGRLVFSTTADGAETVTESFRVDQAQRIIKGATAIRDVANTGGNAPHVQVHSASDREEAGLLMAHWENAAGGPSVRFFKSKSGTIGSFGTNTLSTGDDIGTIEWYGDDDTDGLTASGRITVEVDGSVSTGDVPTRMILSTGNAGSSVEAVRITSGQLVGINVNATPSARLHVKDTAQDVCIIEDDTADAGEGPELTLYRNSASPAASDLIGVVGFDGESSTGVQRRYAGVLAGIVDPTNASEDGDLRLQTIVAGSVAARVTITAGMQVGSPTGGDKGAGTINAAGAYYANGTVGVSAGSFSTITAITVVNGIVTELTGS